MNSPFRTIAPLLITVAVALVVARVMNAELVLEPSLYRNAAEPPGKRLWPTTVPKPMPTFSSNDRSRWATIRALVDHGTYVIGTRDPSQVSEANKYGDTGIIFEDGWQSIDKVLKPAPEGEVREFYSSKPPLFSTLVAGEYWVIKNLLGWTLQDNPFLVVRTILVTINVVPLVIYLLLLMRLVDRLGTTDWGKLFVLAAAGFGTFVTTFAMTLNNHTPAAYTALFALTAAAEIWASGGRQPPVAEEKQGADAPRSPMWLFAVCGFFAALTAALELPAAAFLVLLFGLLLLRDPRRTLLIFLPAALIPVAAWFLTNYVVMGSWKPAYGEFGGPWYEYPGSHWLPDPNKPKIGIDWAFTKESRWTYALHFLIGHHGVFSLTPIWLLPLLWLGFRKPAASTTPRSPWLPLTVLAAVLAVVVIGFFLVWIECWNYGGWTSGPRWLIWLTPFWLLVLLPAADGLGQRRWGRWLGYALLGISAFSASYPAWNPWRHPWLYNLMESWGWISY